MAVVMAINTGGRIRYLCAPLGRGPEKLERV